MDVKPHTMDPPALPMLTDAKITITQDRDLFYGFIGGVQ